jgi:hypothetical protein
MHFASVTISTFGRNGAREGLLDGDDMIDTGWAVKINEDITLGALLGTSMEEADATLDATLDGLVLGARLGIKLAKTVGLRDVALLGACSLGEADATLDELVLGAVLGVALPKTVGLRDGALLGASVGEADATLDGLALGVVLGVALSIMVGQSKSMKALHFLERCWVQQWERPMRPWMGGSHLVMD